MNADKLRSAAGLAGGVILVLSSAMHSFAGWPALRGELDKVHASPDLANNLAMGWHFGGAAMLALGVIAVATFIARLRGRPASLLPAAVTAVLYLAFGAGVTALGAADARVFFLLVFVLPGILLAIGSFRRP